MLFAPAIATLLVLLNVLLYEPIEYDEFGYIFGMYTIMFVYAYGSMINMKAMHITGTSFIFYLITTIYLKKNDQKNTESQQIIVSCKLLCKQNKNYILWQIFIVMCIFMVATDHNKRYSCVTKDTTCLHVEKV